MGEALASAKFQPDRRSRVAWLTKDALLGVSAVGAWALAAISAIALEDVGDWSETRHYAIGTAVIAALLLAALSGGRWWPGVREKVIHKSPWLIVSGLFLTLWELAAAKLGWVPQPFFPPPQALVEVFVWEWQEVGKHLLASLRLVVVGAMVGAAVGFVIGVSIGWSTHIGYWAHPVLRFIGPLPATAWLPIAFFAFPSSWSASTFLIALATGFPVTVLTWSGVASVSNAYYDVARTLGAKPSFLVFKVAIPAALPHVFVGLFMGLGASFAVLVVAEMMGVKSGLGWYLQWAQGWAAYANMYAALLVMSLLCSGAITALFKVRDRLLVWQKGVVKW